MESNFLGHLHSNVFSHAVCLFFHRIWRLCWFKKGIFSSSRFASESAKDMICFNNSCNFLSKYFICFLELFCVNFNCFLNIILFDQVGKLFTYFSRTEVSCYRIFLYWKPVFIWYLLFINAVIFCWRHCFMRAFLHVNRASNLEYTKRLLFCCCYWFYYRHLFGCSPLSCHVVKMVGLNVYQVRELHASNKIFSVSFVSSFFSQFFFSYKTLLAASEVKKYWQGLSIENLQEI